MVGTHANNNDQKGQGVQMASLSCKVAIVIGSSRGAAGLRGSVFLPQATPLRLALNVCSAAVPPAAVVDDLGR